MIGSADLQAAASVQCQNVITAAYRINVNCVKVFSTFANVSSSCSHFDAYETGPAHTDELIGHPTNESYFRRKNGGNTQTHKY